MSAGQLHAGATRDSVEVFRPDWRETVASLARQSPQLTDLVESFPGLLFALATGYADAGRRAAATALVIDGASLRDAAVALGLPYWLKRLPAAAFDGPLARLPDDAEFAERIVQRLPASPDDAAHWLASVSTGCRACHPAFGLWLANGLQRSPRLLEQQPGSLLTLAAWAWHADKPDLLAHRLLRRAWSEQLGLRSALDEVAVWRRRIQLAETLASTDGQPWPADGSALGFEFAMLGSVEDYLAEAQSMVNCLDQYAGPLLESDSRVYSVRKGGVRVADVEIGRHADEAAIPAIRQLKGPRNRRAAPEVWQAAHAWLGQQPVRLLDPPHPRQMASKRRRQLTVRREIWAPYLAAIDPEMATRIQTRLFGPQQRNERRTAEPLPPAGTAPVRG